jgi:hypothetical protein
MPGKSIFAGTGSTYSFESTQAKVFVDLKAWIAVPKRKELI